MDAVDLPTKRKTPWKRWLADWPAFAEQQQQLLLKEGFSLEEIQELYGSALPKPRPPASQ